MFKWLLVAIGKIFGEISVPFNCKKFDLNHYFKIEEMLEKLPESFAVCLVGTDGYASNLFIRFTYLFSKDRRKWKSAYVHTVPFIGIRNGYKYMACESVGNGIQEVKLLKAIGQRDRVKVLAPNPEKMPAEVVKHVITFLNVLLDRDKETNIPYDYTHDLYCQKAMDCSEVVFHALRYAYDQEGIACPVKVFRRFKRDSYLPVDIEFSELFTTVYDSELANLQEKDKVLSQADLEC